MLARSQTKMHPPSVKRAETTVGSPVEVFTRRVFTNVLRKLSAFLAQSDFTISEVAALHLIGQGEGHSIQVLGQKLGLSTSAASRLVSSLVDKGLVVRRADSADARVKTLTCSEEGAELLDRMSVERVEAIFEVATSLPSAISDQILAAVARLNKSD